MLVAFCALARLLLCGANIILYSSHLGRASAYSSFVTLHISCFNIYYRLPAIYESTFIVLTICGMERQNSAHTERCVNIESALYVIKTAYRRDFPHFYFLFVFKRRNTLFAHFAKRHKVSEFFVSRCLLYHIIFMITMNVFEECV